MYIAERALNLGFFTDFGKLFNFVLGVEVILPLFRREKSIFSSATTIDRHINEYTSHPAERVPEKSYLPLRHLCVFKPYPSSINQHIYRVSGAIGACDRKCSARHVDTRAQTSARPVAPVES